MALLFGTFDDIRMDDKGRFSVPTSIRNAMPEEAEATFMVVRGTEGCLFAYPKNEWLKFWEALRKLPVTPENTRLRRRIIGSLKETKVDGQGRVTLTKQLKELGNLDAEIVVLGDGEKLEIWNAEQWKRQQSAAEGITGYDTDYYRALSEIDRNRDGG